VSGDGCGAPSDDFLARAGVIERIGADAVYLQVVDGADAFEARRTAGSSDAITSGAHAVAVVSPA
jgi:hypothetical protein